MDAVCSLLTAETNKQIEYAAKARFYKLRVSLCMLKRQKAITDNSVLRLVYPESRTVVYWLSLKARCLFLPRSLTCKFGHLPIIALVFQKIGIGILFFISEYLISSFSVL